MNAYELAQLIAPGKRPRSGGQGRYQVPCPAHDDRNPSLTVWIDEKGKAAFNCHAGCSHEAIVHKLPQDVSEAVWGTWKAEPITLRMPSRPAPDGTIRYAYRHPDGSLAYHIVRTPDKRFRLEPAGAEPILYNLPEITQALGNGEPIYVVEGEKDADNLTARGLCATTSPFGAGKFAKVDSGILMGAPELYVIPDNDEPGRAHARQVADITGAKILELPGLPEKGDVSDWLGMGHTVEELRRLGGEKPTGMIAGIQFLNLREVMTGDFADEQWLVEPILPKGRQVAIYAQGKTGKSLFVLDMCAALASGRPLLGRERREPVHVLYIDFEMTPGDLQERLADLGYSHDDPDFHVLEEHLHYAMLQPFFPFDTPEGGQQLEALVEATGAVLVVVDTLIRSVKGEENSSDTVKDFNRYTGQRLKARGVTLVRVDHAGKDTAKGQRGTSAKRDDVDVVWRLKAGSKVNGAESMTLINDASRMSWVPQEVPVTRRDNPLRHTLPAVSISHQAATYWNVLLRAGAKRPVTNQEAEQIIRAELGSCSSNPKVEAVRWWNKGTELPPVRSERASERPNGEATESEVGI